MKRCRVILLISGLALLTSCILANDQDSAKPVDPINTHPPAAQEPWISREQAREVAERECIKGGESVGTGYYNEYSETWWFDANLNVEKEGCRPACVVSSDGSWEVNWRCTGMMMDGEMPAMD